MTEYAMRFTNVAKELILGGKLELENVQKGMPFFRRHKSIKADVVIDSITVVEIPTGLHVEYCQKGKAIFEIDTHGLDDGSTLTLIGFDALINIELSGL